MPTNTYKICISYPTREKWIRVRAQSEVAARAMIFIGRNNYIKSVEVV